MSFLSTVDDYGPEFLRASAFIEASNPFLVGDWVSSWIGMEYMAQAIAAWAGIRSKSRGEAVKLGFLLGSRRYQVDTDRFPVGCQLGINVTRLVEGENGLSVFDCKVQSEAGVATANVNVFQPKDVDKFFREGRS